MESRQYMKEGKSEETIRKKGKGEMVTKNEGKKVGKKNMAFG